MYSKYNWLWLQLPSSVLEMLLSTKSQPTQLRRTTNQKLLCFVPMCYVLENYWSKTVFHQYFLSPLLYRTERCVFDPTHYWSKTSLTNIFSSFPLYQANDNFGEGQIFWPSRALECLFRLPQLSSNAVYTNATPPRCRGVDQRLESICVRLCFGANWELIKDPFAT